MEQTYYEMVLAAGINMMESRLLEVDVVNHFLTRRFDRNETGKLHTQTLAAMEPEADTNEKLFAVYRKLHLQLIGYFSMGLVFVKNRRVLPFAVLKM